MKKHKLRASKCNEKSTKKMSCFILFSDEKKRVIQYAGKSLDSDFLY
jgi:hypothetical protein